MAFKIDSKHFIYATGIGIATAAVIGGVIAYRKSLADRMPTKWKKIGEISELICYPIKSCGFIRVDHFNCASIGIENDYLQDRIFMVTKTNGNFITARAYPLLVKIQPSITGDIMTLSAPGMMDITLNFKSLQDTPTNQTVVWDEAVETIDCGEEIARWFSRFILQDDFGLRLAYYPSQFPTRGVREKNKKFGFMFPKDVGALHDASSYMLINEASVQDLNTKLEKHVSAVRFRPNFVVKGVDAYEEDKWNWIKIGNETVFRNVKPCTRCVFVNVNEDTGIKDPKQPLKTLKGYRTVKELGDSPVLGIHLGIREKGVVKMGDAVYIPA